MDKWEKRFYREREARKVAENLLEEKSLELYNKNEELKILNTNLENRVKEEVEKNREKDKILFQQSKLAIMGEMISMIAHQWRQPLNSIALLIQDYKDAYEYNEINQEYIDKHEMEALKILNYMSKTIDDFYHFNVEKIKANISIDKLIDNTLFILKHKIEKNNINIIKNIDYNKNIEIYENEFKQILLNIVNNAIDALLQTDNIDKNIIIDVYEENQKIIFAISDNGGGIDKDIIDRVFDPYFSTKGKNGTGLGLYMSKMIVDNHLDGLLRVENIKDGAKFVIELEFE
jgi:signal transduction histidine kinase